MHALQPEVVQAPAGNKHTLRHCTACAGGILGALKWLQQPARVVRDAVIMNNLGKFGDVFDELYAALQQQNQKA